MAIESREFVITGIVDYGAISEAGNAVVRLVDSNGRFLFSTRLSRISEPFGIDGILMQEWKSWCQNNGNQWLNTEARNGKGKGVLGTWKRKLFQLAATHSENNKRRFLGTKRRKCVFPDNWEWASSRMAQNGMNKARNYTGGGWAKWCKRQGERQSDRNKHRLAMEHLDT